MNTPWPSAGPAESCTPHTLKHREGATGAGRVVGGGHCGYANVCVGRGVPLG